MTSSVQPPPPFRRATASENMQLLLARLGDKMAPAERDELRAATARLATLENLLKEMKGNSTVEQAARSEARPDYEGWFAREILKIWRAFP